MTDAAPEAKRLRKAAKRNATAGADIDTAVAAELPDAKRKQKNDDTASEKPKWLQPSVEAQARFTVFVGGLTKMDTAAETKFREDFAKFGDVQKVKLCKGTRVFAFIEYTHKESADEALKLHGTVYAGSTLTVNLAGINKPAKDDAEPTKDSTIAKPSKDGTDRRVFVAGLPKDNTEEKFREFFGACGKVENVRIKPKRGIGFIQYRRRNNCKEALTLHGTEYHGKTISVEMAGERRGKEFQVIVSGFENSTSEYALRRKFEPCGEIEAFRLPFDANGESKGMAFVYYKDEGSCAKALKLNGAAFGESKLSVRLATDRHKSTKSKITKPKSTKGTPDEPGTTGDDGGDSKAGKQGKSKGKGKGKGNDRKGKKDGTHATKSDSIGEPQGKMTKFADSDSE